MSALLAMLRTRWAGMAAAVVAVLATLGWARRAGRLAERADATRRAAEARERAEEAAVRFRGDGAARRLRDGTF